METSRSFVCWIQFGVLISPLFNRGLVLYLLDTICDKNVELSGLIDDITKDNLAVGPEYFFDVTETKLPT